MLGVVDSRAAVERRRAKLRLSYLRCTGAGQLLYGCSGCSFNLQAKPVVSGGYRLSINTATAEHVVDCKGPSSISRERPKKKGKPKPAPTATPTTAACTQWMRWMRSDWSRGVMRGRDCVGRGDRRLLRQLYYCREQGCSYALSASFLRWKEWWVGGEKPLIQLDVPWRPQPPDRVRQVQEEEEELIERTGRCRDTKTLNPLMLVLFCLEGVGNKGPLLYPRLARKAYLLSLLA